jgi:hypothetical protein
MACHPQCTESLWVGNSFYLFLPLSAHTHQLSYHFYYRLIGYRSGHLGILYLPRTAHSLYTRSPKPWTET